MEYIRYPGKNGMVYVILIPGLEKTGDAFVDTALYRLRMGIPEACIYHSYQHSSLKE